MFLSVCLSVEVSLNVRYARPQSCMDQSQMPHADSQTHWAGHVKGLFTQKPATFGKSEHILQNVAQGMLSN